MSIAATIVTSIDNGGRRLGFDRRRFDYTDYSPPRRIKSDRRSGVDRRVGIDRRKKINHKISADIVDLRKIKDRRHVLAW